MTVRLYRVIVPVPEVEAGVAFYARLLDMPGERVSPERHYFHCGDVILAVVGPEGRREPFRPNLDHLYFAVDDLEAAFERARGAGALSIEDAISTRAWGERSFYLRDPFGNPLCFADERTLFTSGYVE